MSKGVTEPYPARRVPAWPGRWLILLRLYPEVGAEYPNLFRLWLRGRAAFWQYVLGVEEWRQLREAVVRGDACALTRPTAAPPAGAWRDP